MDKAESILLNHLPAVFRASNDLKALLSVFDALLFGTSACDHESTGGPASSQAGMGLEEKIANIASLLDPDPGYAPVEFLPWLSQWVALSADHGLDERALRKLIRKIIPLYASRGTWRYADKLLSYLVPDVHALTDEQRFAGFTLGEPGLSEIGVKTRLGEDPPFHFRVFVNEPSDRFSQEEQAAISERIRSVVDLAKPAHTSFDVEWRGASEPALSKTAARRMHP